MRQLLQGVQLSPNGNTVATSLSLVIMVYNLTKRADVPAATHT